MLICTDVVARGIDFQDVHHIIQVDPPQVTEKALFLSIRCSFIKQYYLFLFFTKRIQVSTSIVLVELQEKENQER